MKLLKTCWARLTQVGPNSDFVHAGDDRRWNPFGIFGAIQRKLSFQSDVEPLSVLLCIVPPMVAVNVPIWKGKYFLFRFGWRFDRTWTGYIFPEAVIKILDHTQFY